MGIEDGAYHVRGYVDDAPVNDSQEDADQDLYWDGFYAVFPEPIVGTNPDHCCKGGTCGEIKYPMAGLAFGFKSCSAPLGADAADKVGVAFKIKLGSVHGLDEHARSTAPSGITDEKHSDPGHGFSARRRNSA